MNFFKDLSFNNINSFKEKHTKYTTYINNNKNSINTTLDNKHNEKVNEFINNDIIYKKKKKKCLNLINAYTKLENISISELLPEEFNKKAILKNDIELLQLDINKIINRYSEINYYDSTIDILMDYYNNINDNNFDKSKLYNKYMKIVYNQNINKNKKIYNIKICNKCKIEKILHITDGYIICTKCGESEIILLENEKNYYKDSTNDIKICSYKRVNHLSEILNQFQAKETTEINNEFFEKIKNELNIQRIYDYKNLDYKTIKFILKKLKLNKYYEHIHHIINILNGIPPPSITREQEENIKKIFKDIQKPFSLFRPPKRKNFLNYNYIIHKICELLEYDNFLPNFPLLKSRINLEEQDIVWEKICNFNNYQFIPSI